MTKTEYIIAYVRASESLDQTSLAEKWYYERWRESVKFWNGRLRTVCGIVPKRNRKQAN